MAIPLRMWLISLGDPFGLHCWFDPSCEVVELRPLTSEEKAGSIDLHGSVSALTEAEASVRKNQLIMFPEGTHHGS